MQFYKRTRLLPFFLLFVIVSHAQTEFDAIMMNKKQFCGGFEYMHSSWDEYWEGSFKRNNLNLGTVTTQSVMFMPAYGITNSLTIMGAANYVWAHASAGTLQGMKGVQDLSLHAKWIPFQTKIGKGKLTAFAIAGLSTPLTDYVVDFLPLSIGLGSTNLTGRAMVDYNYQRMTVTGSAAYIRRSNVKLDRDSYYDTQLRQTNEVRMPDASQFQLRAGYRGRYFIAEGLVTKWTILGGFDITKNNMPFPSNRMNSTTAGISLKYTIKNFTNLSVLAGANATLEGRNMGQATTYSAGAFYTFYVSKKPNTKK